MNDAMAAQPHLAEALGNAIAVYDQGTFEHSVRVGSHARLLGEALGLTNVELEALGWAGALHDLGKLAVPEVILRKKGTLTLEEWAHIKVHSVVGYELLLAVSPALVPVAEAVRAHHERWDGGGYPNGLAGEQIPLLGRIIALADVFDALTHDRPYRDSALPGGVAREVIELWSGTHFDPALVPVYLKVLDHDGSPSSLAR